MLEVLPPAAMDKNTEINMGGFLVGEPTDHNEAGQPRYQSYFDRDDEEFFSGPLMTVKEFAAAIANVDLADWANDHEEANEKDQEELDAIDSLGEEVVTAALALGIPVESIEDAYRGKYDSDEDFAREYADEIGDIKDGVQWPYTCIDWEQAARELMYDFMEQDGYYFYSNY